MCAGSCVSMLCQCQGLPHCTQEGQDTGKDIVLHLSRCYGQGLCTMDWLAHKLPIIPLELLQSHFRRAGNAEKCCHVQLCICSVDGKSGPHIAGKCCAQLPSCFIFIELHK